MSRKIIAWIGGLSLIAMGIVAVGGIVALRLLATGAESRAVTGAPALGHLFQAAAPSGDPALAVAEADATDAQARKDCAELLAKDGDHVVFHKALKFSSDEHALAFAWEGGQGHPGMAVAGLAPVVDPLAVVAAELGMTAEALREALKDDGGLKALAEAKGKTLAQLETAVEAAARKDLRERLQAQVDSGELTAAQADAHAAALELKLLDAAEGRHGLKVAIEVDGMGGMIHRFIGKALHGKEGEANDEDVVIGMTAATASGAAPFSFKLPEPMSQTDQDAVKAVLEQAVQAGGLSRAQADAAIARLSGPPLPLMLDAVPAVPAVPAAPLAPAAPSER